MYFVLHKECLYAGIVQLDSLFSLCTLAYTNIHAERGNSMVQATAPHLHIRTQRHIQYCIKSVDVYQCSSQRVKVASTVRAVDVGKRLWAWPKRIYILYVP